MKRAYRKPQAKMVDFIYDTQVVAESGPPYERGEKTQWEWFPKCQVKQANCELLYQTDMVCDMDEGTDFSLRRP